MKYFLQVLVDENKIQKQEIKRLKEDNTRLIRQTKQAMAERDQVLVSTCSRGATLWVLFLAPFSIRVNSLL